MSYLQRIFDIPEMPEEHTVVVGDTAYTLTPARGLQRADFVFREPDGSKSRFRIRNKTDVREKLNRLIDGNLKVESGIKIAAINKLVSAWVEQRQTEVAKEIMEPSLREIEKKRLEAEKALKNIETSIQNFVNDKDKSASIENLAALGQIVESMMTAVLPSPSWYVRIENGHVELCIDKVEWRDKDKIVEMTSPLMIRLRTYNEDGYWKMVGYTESDHARGAAYSMGHVRDGEVPPGQMLLHPHFSVQWDKPVGKGFLVSLCFWSELKQPAPNKDFVEYAKTLKLYAVEVNRLLHSPEIKHFGTPGIVHMAACVESGFAESPMTPSKILKVFGLPSLLYKDQVKQLAAAHNAIVGVRK